MNPLPLIQLFIEDGPDCYGRYMWNQIPRATIQQWLEKTEWYQANCSGRGSTDLALDCLTAAGIGRGQEQTGTVYCRCSHMTSDVYPNADDWR